MEVDYENPSEVNSHAISLILNTNILEPSKKRKLQAEHLALPSPKHACLDTTEEEASDVPSGKGSNSFSGDISDCQMHSSSYAELHSSSCDSSDTSTLIKGKSAVECCVVDSDIVEKSALDYTSNLTYICSEHEMDNFGHYSEKGIEDILYSSSDMNPNNLFVLSSGRWSISRDGEESSRKPTIDQEFEEYFSTLML